MIVRGPRKERSFTIVDNAVLRDQRLSFRARGVLNFLLSQPEGYTVSSEKLAECGHEGRDAIRTALREIEEVGYLVRERRQRPNGQWECVSTVYEEPTTGNPSSVPPGTTREGAGRAEDGSADVGLSGDKRSTGLEELEPEGLKQTPLTPLSGGDDDLVEDPIGPSKASKASNRKRAPTAKDVSDADFAAFWSTYPRKVEKDKARVALAKALTRASLNTILVGACAYRDDPNREAQYTKHPATWLNAGCWDDDPLPPRSDNGVKHANPKAGTFVGGTRRITEEELEEAGL